MRLSRVSEECYQSLPLATGIELGVNQIVHQVEGPSCPARRVGARDDALKLARNPLTFSILPLLIFLFVVVPTGVARTPFAA